MPRKKKTRRPHDGGGSVYKLDNGKWRAQVSRYEAVVVDGQEVMRRRFRREDHLTRIDAELARQRMSDEVQRLGDLAKHQPPVPQPARETVAGYLDWWLANVVPQRDVKDGAVRDYGHAVRRVKAVLGDYQLTALTPEDGDTLVMALKQTLAPRTVHGTIRVLNDALNGAVRRKKLAANPFAELDLPKIPRYRPIVLSPADVQRFRAAVAGHRYALIYDLYLFTGMREGEVLGMQWANLDWQAGAYHLTHDLDLRLLELDTLKTEKSRRTLYFPAPLMTALRTQFLDQQRLARGDTWNPWSLVFCSVHGTPIRANSLWRHFKRVCAALELSPKTTVHHLRHTFRHHAADHMGAHVMQDWMGHSEMATTFEIYGEGASDRAKQAVAARLEDLYNETT